MSQLGTVAVIGAGISGLIAAQVLSEAAERVLLIDRDFLDVSGKRKGVAQASHLHVLLQRGRLALEELFPGLDTELAEHGAPEVDWSLDTAWLSRKGWFPRSRSSIVTRSCSRNLLEETIRLRVLKLKNIEVMERTEVKGLQIHQSRRNFQVESIDLQRGSLKADFVVNTSGRTGTIYRQGQVQKVDAGIGYGSCLMEIPSRRMSDFKQLYIQMDPPRVMRGGVMIPVENGIYSVTLIGSGQENTPPSQEKAFLEFAKNLSSPLFFDVIRQSRMLTPIRIYRRTAGCRVVPFLKNRPHNLIEMGDALCAFNPVYGQGMTVAALSGLELRKSLLNGLEKIQSRLYRLTQFPWTLAVSEDLRIRSVKATGLGVCSNLFGKALPLLTDYALSRAVHKEEAHQRFLRVLHLMDSPISLLPGVS
jgi:flavin-dependent dehydrogenase